MIRRRTRSFLVASTFAFFVAPPTGPTQAASIGEVVSLLQTYNLIASGNVSSASEVDGRSLVGGNVSGGNYDIHKVASGVAGTPALTVGGGVANLQVNGQGLVAGGAASGTVTVNGGGNVSVGSVASGARLTSNANGSGSTTIVGNIGSGAAVTTNGGNVVYGGTNSGTLTANGGKVLNQTITPAVDANAVATTSFATLSRFSTSLGSLAGNSTITSANGRATFNAQPGTNGIAVFTITNAETFFSQAREIAFSLNGAKDVVVNVINGSAGANLAINASFLGGQAIKLGSSLLWNFENATSITVGSQFGGTLLAVDANLTTTANLEGTAVVRSLVQGAEIHSRPINGSISAVPLPPALLLFASAIGGLAIFGRRPFGRPAARTGVIPLSRDAAKAGGWYIRR